MWFKNLRLFRLVKPFDLSPEALHEQLTAQAFRPCGRQEPFSYGWVPPLGPHSEQLTHAASGRIMLCARREEKLLPAAVVREAVGEKVAAIEQAQARKVRRKEREGLREEVLHDLLPRAFSRSTCTHAYIDPRAGWLVVDAASAARAEDLVSLLRASLGNLATRLPAVRQSPPRVLTAWLEGKLAPKQFLIEDQCELRDPGEQGGVVRCTRQDLSADEIQAHLAAGKQVTRLALAWDERIGCVLSDKLEIRRLRFLDLIQEAAREVETDDAVVRFDTDFALMTLELARFIPAVLDLFGGEEATAD